MRSLSIVCCVAHPKPGRKGSDGCVRRKSSPSSQRLSILRGSSTLIPPRTKDRSKERLLHVPASSKRSQDRIRHHPQCGCFGGLRLGKCTRPDRTAVMHAGLRALDPNITTAYIARNFAYMVYDTLLATDASGKIQPQSSAVTGVPSCHLRPVRRTNVYVSPVARWIEPHGHPCH